MAYTFPDKGVIRSVWLEYFPDDFGEKTVEDMEALAGLEAIAEIVNLWLINAWNTYSSYTPRGPRRDNTVYFQKMINAIKGWMVHPK